MYKYIEIHISEDASSTKTVETVQKITKDTFLFIIYIATELRI